MNEIIKRFQYAIEKDRLSHLYLISGALGVTKKTLVKEITYLIFKHHNDYEHLRHQLDSFNHPNLVYIAKEGQTIKKEQILNLQQEFSKTSLVTGPRIFIIEQAETMSNQAANSLLKFLEEPKDTDTIGFLLVDDMNFILPTIQSRAQVIRLTDLSDDAFIQTLIENEIDIKNAHFIATRTKALSEALSIYGDQKYIETVEFIDTFIEWLKRTNTSLTPLFMSISQMLYQDKDEIIFILDIICQVFLDILHIHMNQKVHYEFMKESLLEFVKRISTDTAQEVILRLQETIKNLRLPVNINLSLSSLSLDLEGIISNG
ncbi:MAG: hypothetical protein WCZ19_05405 [Acholeplasma sp.]